MGNPILPSASLKEESSLSPALFSISIKSPTLYEIGEAGVRASPISSKLGLLLLRLRASLSLDVSYQSGTP